MAQTQEHLGTGRRKTAVARVRIAPGAGKVTVNGRALENYFLTESQRLLAMQALAVTESASKYNIRVNVSGGGPNGQAGAVRHGIARALQKMNAELRPSLKKAGHIRRDPREKERKKAGQPGARKRFQFSKR